MSDEEVGDRHWPWTLTLGELRALDMPDETQVLVMVEEFDFLDTAIQYQFPAALDHAPALVIGGGQKINYELDMITRLDVYLDFDPLEGGENDGDN
jgi:hypothetical protein